MEKTRYRVTFLDSEQFLRSIDIRAENVQDVTGTLATVLERLGCTMISAEDYTIMEGEE